MKHTNGTYIREGDRVWLGGYPVEITRVWSVNGVVHIDFEREHELAHREVCDE